MSRVSSSFIYQVLPPLVLEPTVAGFRSESDALSSIKCSERAARAGTLRSIHLASQSTLCPSAASPDFFLCPVDIILQTMHLIRNVPSIRLVQLNLLRVERPLVIFLSAVYEYSNR